MQTPKIKLLDCTLRDGGRIIDCQFSDTQIANISLSLANANIDIIELGFLDNTKNIPNSTYFNDIRNTETFLKNRNTNTFYTVFANFGRFDFYTLPAANKNLPDGIRIGFTQEDFNKNKKQIAEVFNHVKKLGYITFMQPLNTPVYEKEEFLTLIDFANEITPYSFAIVDTNGSMYEQELEFYYNLIERNLKSEINLDFHSHNNLQLSYALAMWLSKQKTARNLILDSTLSGMGRGGGNLNTELIVQYMNQKFQTNYDLKLVIKLIDNELLPLKNKNICWGYSIQAFLGGIFRVHPNKIKTLYEEYINAKD